MAQGITESVIEEIKSRIDLVDLISSYGIAVKHNGSSVLACCPFHNEKTPSFHINQNKGFYHCFGCSESGDAIKFVQKQEGLTFVEAVKSLASRCGVTIVERADPEAGKRKRLYALMAELAQFYHRCLNKTKEAQLAREYLAKRGIDEATQEAWIIGYAPNGVSHMAKWAEKYGYTLAEMEAAGVVKPPTRSGDNGYHRFASRLMFTIRDKQSRVVAFSGRQLIENKKSGKYVNSPETLIFKKSNVLFGFDKAAGAIARSKSREVILCEGQIDVIKLHMAGFTTAVASQGTSFTDEHAQMVKRVADTAVLMYDDDAAGRKATIATARKLLAMDMPVRVVSLPGGADPDSFLAANSAEALRTLIDNALSVVAFQCRVERDKEANANSTDALYRISRAVLETISASSSPILKAAMVDEAAKILSLPTAALTEELSKVKLPVSSIKAHPPTQDQDEEYDSSYEDEPIVEDIIEEDDFEVESSEASVSIAPPSIEFALMEFLMTHEYDLEIDNIVGRLLPDDIYGSDFTRSFVNLWRVELAKGEDMFAEFSQALTPFEREWFDKVLLNAGRAEASALSAVEIMHDFVRTLWIAYLKRNRESIPTNSDGAYIRKMELSMQIKRLQQLQWGEVDGMISSILKGS